MEINKSPSSLRDWETLLKYFHSAFFPNSFFKMSFFKTKTDSPSNARQSDSHLTLWSPRLVLVSNWLSHIHVLHVRGKKGESAMYFKHPFSSGPLRNARDKSAEKGKLFQHPETYCKLEQKWNFSARDRFTLSCSQIQMKRGPHTRDNLLEGFLFLV